jgi:hypothetical protein
MFDKDILTLETADRVQYEFDLMNHNIHKASELTYVYEALGNIKGLIQKLKSPKTMISGIMYILYVLMTILIIVLLVLWVHFREDEMKVSTIKSTLYIVMLFYAVLIIFSTISDMLFIKLKALVTISKRTENQ